jgi:hypothetical protein
MAGAVAGAFIRMRLANLMPRRMLRESILAAGVIMTMFAAVKVDR